MCIFFFKTVYPDEGVCVPAWRGLWLSPGAAGPASPGGDPKTVPRVHAPAPHPAQAAALLPTHTVGSITKH